ncbi:helix-turn-helix domain-containing protein [Streptomyces sp. NPDC059837]|uniref:AlbA family DNA-binding domain-containing protein n=1 Tax=Streptomyces sp. NPDC059837 TaxID=3346968 RepID=UPI00365538C8
MDFEGSRSALSAYTPTVLLELREGQWLDAKSVPYEPQSPGKAEELAKDVASFANSGGGLLVLGTATRLNGGEESSTGSSPSAGRRSISTGCAH